MDVDVAWVALGVAVLSLAWQIIDAWQRRRTNVAVDVRHLAVPANSPDGPNLLDVPAVGLDDRPVVWSLDPEEPLTYVVTVVAVNRGETTESVADLRVFDLARRTAAGASDGTGARELPPRDRVTWAFRVDGLSFDAREGFIAEAVLGSGKVVRSGPHRLDDDLLDEIREGNRRRRGTAG